MLQAISQIRGNFANGACATDHWTSLRKRSNDEIKQSIGKLWLLDETKNKRLIYRRERCFPK
jgi:hypothetical protein